MQGWVSEETAKRHTSYPLKQVTVWVAGERPNLSKDTWASHTTYTSQVSEENAHDSFQMNKISSPAMCLFALHNHLQQL